MGEIAAGPVYTELILCDDPQVPLIEASIKRTNDYLLQFMFGDSLCALFAHFAPSDHTDAVLFLLL